MENNLIKTKNKIIDKIINFFKFKFINYLVLLSIIAFLIYQNYFNPNIKYKDNVSIAINEKRELVIIENDNIIVFSDSLTTAIHSLISSVILQDYYNNRK